MKVTSHGKNLDACIVFSQYYNSAYFVANKLSKDPPNDFIGIYAGGDKSGYFSNGAFHKVSKKVTSPKLNIA